MDKFYAGSKSEILNCSKRGIQHFHLKYLLVHHGEFRILAEGIMLGGGWRTLNWDMIREVILGDDEVLSARCLLHRRECFF